MSNVYAYENKVSRGLDPIIATFPEWLNQVKDTAPRADLMFELSGAGGSGGVWTGYSFQTFYDRVQAMAAALRAMGLKKGIVAALMARNSLAWDVFHFACLYQGIVVVGVDYYAPADYKNSIFKACSPACIFIDSVDQLENVRLGDGVRIVASHPPFVFGSEQVFDYNTLVQKGGNPDVSVPVQGDDPALIVFSSGTTGAPKGILYTHRQLMMAIDALSAHYEEVDSIPQELRSLPCWMPLSNLFQRMLNIMAIEKHFAIYYCPDPVKFVDLLPTIKPSILVGVPRLFEKIAKGALEKLERIPTFLRGLMIGTFVRHVVQKKLGGHVRFLATGSAKTPHYVLEFFEKIGLRLYELYGMSENIIPMSGNNRAFYRLGSVGVPLKYNHITICPDGEIAVDSPGVGVPFGQTGPRPQPFQTNDLGHIDKDGFLFIEGRKDSLFKTSTGLRVAPTMIEEYLSGIIGIENTVVMGAGRKLLIAVISSALDPEVLRAEVGKVNQDLPSKYRVCGIVQTKAYFGSIPGLTTPNLKVKRKAVEEFYLRDINSLYEALDRVDSKETPPEAPLIRLV